MRKLLPYLVVIGISLLCPLILAVGYYLEIREHRTPVYFKRTVSTDTLKYWNRSADVVYSDYKCGKEGSFIRTHQALHGGRMQPAIPKFRFVRKGNYPANGW